MSQPGPVIVIFGITGDLSKRYLLPTLYSLFSRDLLPPDTVVIGTSRQALTTEALLSTVELCVSEADQVCDPVVLRKIQNALLTRQLDPSQTEDFRTLKRKMDELDSEGKRTRLFYLSIPADAYGSMVECLGETGLNDDRSRLMLEKPFGNSLVSARKLIGLVEGAFKEEQVYRIDHYLAKGGTLKLMAFRFSNPSFADIWNSDHISQVTVRALETIGIENRTDFYEQTGALRDFAQNHLMQLLATVMMDEPSVMDSQSIHQAKQSFLKSLLPAEPDRAVRGQYQGYGQEVGNPSSTTETYVRFELVSANQRWQGTKLILETGKCLAERVAEITVDFKTGDSEQTNQLVFRIQPEEKIDFKSRAPEHAFDQAVSAATTDFNYKDDDAGSAGMEAYERVLSDAIQGDQSLFASSEEVLESWRVIQPLLDAWDKEAAGKPLPYQPGSSGPAA